MELVFKKDGFITKFFACLFIAIFLVMCVIGYNVYATDFYSEELDTNISIPDWIEENNYNYMLFFRHISGNSYQYNILISSSDFSLLEDDGTNYIINTLDNSPFYFKSLQSSPLSYVSNHLNSLQLSDFTEWNEIYRLNKSFINSEFSTFHVNLIDTNGNLVFQKPENQPSQRGANGDVEYDSYINGLVGSNGGNLSNIANDITSGDIGSSVENSDKTSIFNISQKLVGGFSKVFGFFNFVDTVKNSIVDIYNLLINTTEAPKLYMSFNHQYLQGEHCILDLTWYAPYKDFGDGIICAFMYACFMWHVFKNLYNIISGQNSVIDRAESYMSTTIPGLVKGE